MLNQYLEVGKVTNVHGLMGEVKVQDPVCGRGPLPHDGTAGPGPHEHGHYKV